MTEELALRIAVLTVYALLATAATVLIGLALRGKVTIDEQSSQMLANIRTDLAWWGKVLRTLWSHRHETALAVLRWVVIMSKGVLKPLGIALVLLRIPHNALAKASRPYKGWHSLWWSSHVHGVVAIAVAATMYALVVAPTPESGLPVVPIDAKTWTTPEDFATFKHEGTRVTADGKITLARKPATWAPVKGVPYGRSPYCDVSVAPDGTIAIARGTDDPIILIGGIWCEVDNGGLDTRAVLALAANDIYFGSALGGISHYNGYEVTGEYSLTPMGNDVTDIDGDTDTVVAVGGGGSIARKLPNSSWDTSLTQLNITESFKRVKYLNKDDIWWVGTHAYHWDGKQIERFDVGATLGSANPLDLTAIDGVAGDMWIAYNEMFLEAGAMCHTNGITFDAPIPVSDRPVDDVLYLGTRNVWAASWACENDNLYRSNGTGFSPAGVGAVSSIDGDGDQMWGVGPPNTVLKSTPGPYQTVGTATIVFTPKEGEEQIWKADPLVKTTEPAGTKVEVEFSTNGTDWTTELGDVDRSERIHIRAHFQMGDSEISPSVDIIHVSH